MHRSCSFGVPMTDTKTLACCKSPDTSARVTVTFLIRGSFSSNRIVSLATSRITSATRASRCVFMDPFAPVADAPGSPRYIRLARLYVELVVEQLGDRVAPQGGDDLLQGATDMARLVADDGHAEDRELAVVQGV